MSPDGELVGQGSALIRQPHALGLGRCRVVFDLGRRVSLLVARIERLQALRIVPIDGNCLEAHFPGFEVGLGNLGHRGLLRQVDRLGDRPGQERLHRTHHPQVAHVVDRAHAIGRTESTIKDRQMLFLQVRRTFDGLFDADVVDDIGHFIVTVTQLLERIGHRVVDDLHQAAINQLLVFHQGDVRLHTGRIAVHHETDGASRGQNRDLGVAVPVVKTQGISLAPDGFRLFEQVGRHPVGGDVVDRRAVHANDLEHGLAVLGVAFEGTDLTGDFGTCQVGLATHQ